MRLLRTLDNEVSLPILRDAARDPRGEVCARAYHYLFEGLDEPSELLSLLAEAAADGDEHVRREAAIGLGRLVAAWSMSMNARRGPVASTGLTPERRDEALRALRVLLKDPSSWVRAEAAGRWASSVGPRRSRPISPGPSATPITPSGSRRRSLWRWPAARRIRRRPALVAVVASADALPDRLAAVQAVRTMNEAVQDRAVSALIDLLSRGDPDIVPDVIACLPEAGPRAKSAVPALEAMLDHAEPALRAAAAMAIVAIESPETVQAHGRECWAA